VIELKNLITVRAASKVLLSLAGKSIITVLGNVSRFLRKEQKMEKPAPQKREVFDCYGSRRRTWCGPYVVAAVAKIDYETSYQAFRTHTGKRHVAGTSHWQCRAVLERFGVDSGKVERPTKRKKLYHYLRENMDNKLYIVCVSNHWVLVDGRDNTITDSWTAGEWKHISESEHKNRFVKYFFPILSRPRF
jgi:hypothetical protein